MVKSVKKQKVHFSGGRRHIRHHYCYDFRELIPPSKHWTSEREKNVNHWESRWTIRSSLTNKNLYEAGF